jgi:hypothetical protein
MKALNLKLVITLLFALTAVPVSKAYYDPKDDDGDYDLEYAVPDNNGRKQLGDYYRKLDQRDIDHFKTGFKLLLNEYQKNAGSFDLAVLRPKVDDLFRSYKEYSHLTDQEFYTFKQRYDKLQSDAIKGKWDDKKKLEELLGLLNFTIDEYAKTPLKRKSENEICTQNLECLDGLTCVAAPLRAKDELKKSLGNNAASCLDQGQKTDDPTKCCSQTLENGVCQVVKLCYAPVKEGSSCTSNPNCANGIECREYDVDICGLGAFFNNGQSCKSNDECSSQNCVSGKCQAEFKCLECVESGITPTRGKKCCPGLIEETLPGAKQPVCVPGCPPFMVKGKKDNSFDIIGLIMSLVISDAKADSATNEYTRQIKQNQGTYGNMYSVKQAMKDTDMKFADKDTIKNVPVFAFTEKSNFDSCDINFKADFYLYLQNLDKFTTSSNQTIQVPKGKVFDIETSLLAFEFMALGDGVQDYWGIKNNGSAEQNIHARMKEIAKKHQNARHELYNTFTIVDQEVRCLCLDKNGYEKLDQSNQAWFQDKCPELYQNYLNEKQILVEKGVDNGDYDGDASGVKYKRMLVAWTAANAKLQKMLYISNSASFSEIFDLSEWTRTGAAWNEVETKSYNVFNFTIQHGGGLAAGAIMGALLAAGVIAIMAGFSMASTLSVWAAAGIITASAVTGAGGMWLVGALKGAWLSQGPTINDETVAGRVGYKCGKKSTCTDYRRVLNQPYNKICGIHASANACVRNFVVFNDEGVDKILVDPFIPLDVARNSIITDDRAYATHLEDGFKRALDHMKNLRPGGNQSMSYLETPFITANVVGSYTPTIKKTYMETYGLSQKAISEIKEKAKAYAISQSFFDSSMTENLDKFADYAFKFHFVWPKTSRTDRIAYPLPGLTAYLDIIGSGLDTVKEASFGGVSDYTTVHQNYVNDLHRTLTGLGRTNRIAGDDSKGNIVNIQNDRLDDEIKSLEEAMKRTDAFQSALNGKINSSGQLSGSGVGSIDTSSLRTEDGQLLAALTQNNAIRDRQKLRLDNFKRALGDSAQGKRLTDAQNKIRDEFFSPVGNSGSGSGSGYGSSSVASAAPAASAPSQNTGKDGDKDDKDGSNSNWGSNSAGFNSGSGNSGPDYSKAYGGRGGSNSSSSSNYGSGLSEYDSRRISDAIDARNKDKDKYDVKDGNTLFEIVTKAYIRNYDKVLTKRKTIE